MYPILHIDNSQTILKAFKQIFLENDYEYYTALTPVEAMEILKTKKINLIIAASEIGNISCDRFITEINSTNFRNIPVVILTSRESIELKHTMFSLGVVDYINKNISPENIVNYIGNIRKKDQITEYLKEMQIAVLDDSELELTIIKNILEMYGINKVDYYNSAEQLLSSGKMYNIYLTDLVLPDMSGEQIIMEVRKKTAKAVIIAISAIDSYKTISNILMAGADDYITKPFNVSIFMARLKTCLRTYLLLEELEEKNERLKNMVIRDGLTNLYNHKYMIERLDMELKEAERYKKNVSVLMFDIDFFKKVNDTYGHQKGDEVLIGVSETIKKTLRDTDVVGRYGGEEFMAILTETNEEKAHFTAERVRKAVEELSFKSDIENFKVSISGGVAEFKGETAQKLIEKADKRLYIAKKSGRNKMIAFDE